MRNILNMVAEFVALVAFFGTVVVVMLLLSGCEAYPELDGKIDEGQAKGLWDLVMPIFRHEG